MFDFFNLFRKSRAAEEAAAEEAAYRHKYQSFQNLLAGNNLALELITDLEEICHGTRPFTLEPILERSERLIKVVYDLAEDVNALSGGKYPELFDAVERIGVRILREVVRKKEIEPTDLTLPLSRLSLDNAAETGGKAASLGEVANRVHLPTPRGFAATSYACHRFMTENGLYSLAADTLKGLDVNDTEALLGKTEAVRHAILSAPLSPDLEAQLLARADKLYRDHGPDLRLAVRSSATSEDSEASFAGQHSSVLNVRRDGLPDAYKKVVASVFNPRAVYYRRSRGYPDDHVIMSCLILTMVDAKASGVMYTRDPNDARRDVILLNAVWGLGVGAVEGALSTDLYEVDKKTLAPVACMTACKLDRVTLDPRSGLITEAVPAVMTDQPCLDGAHLRTLAEYGLKLEEHYGSPLDIEWAMDQDDRLIILQARPLNLDLSTVPDSGRTKPDPDYASLFPDNPVLLQGGATASRGKAAGPAYILTTDHNLLNIPKGTILIAPQTSPRYVSILGRVQAIVTDVGGVTGHMASVAREFGVPTLVGTGNATKVIPHGAEVTVDASHRVVLAGRVERILERKKAINPMKGSPAYKTAHKALKSIAILNLVDPDAPDFTAEGCRTLHDVIRFTHEVAMREMFRINEDLTVDKRFAVRVKVPLPMKLYAVDLGGAFRPGCGVECGMPDIASIPFLALLRGMTHPSVRWVGAVNTDWKGFAAIVAESVFQDPTMDERMGGPSYAAVSHDYLNFNSRLGYHYATVDTFCGPNVNDNYVTFSFKGGAADLGRRSRRALLIAAILKRLGFKTKLKGDMVKGVIKKYEGYRIEEKLDMVGRLLGSVRLLDMVLADDGQIEWYSDQFFRGNYTFDRDLAEVPRPDDSPDEDLRDMHR